ncbi:hypothetical protein BZG36_05525 [Bifiguratus adelaidae]|uniref:Uncharacterized protein n=1 Tax=Bifiguratus adelaidae TaxID=1938954 RepID=A0A261XTK7_9FUNG|nr:hypothetical protein BZG36_05525 [Bifiguratus adelaidae]
MHAINRPAAEPFSTTKVSGRNADSSEHANVRFGLYTIFCQGSCESHHERAIYRRKIVALGTYYGQITVIDLSRLLAVGYPARILPKSKESDKGTDWPTCVRARKVFIDQQETEAPLRLHVGTRSVRILLHDVDLKTSSVRASSSLATELGQRVVHR